MSCWKGEASHCFDPDVEYHPHAGVYQKIGDVDPLYGMTHTTINASGIFLQVIEDVQRFLWDERNGDYLDQFHRSNSWRVQKVVTTHEIAHFFSGPHCTAGTSLPCVMEAGEDRDTAVLCGVELKRIRQSEEADSD